MFISFITKKLYKKTQIDSITRKIVKTNKNSYSLEGIVNSGKSKSTIKAKEKA